MALTLRQKAGWGLADMGVVIFVVVKQLLVFAYLTSHLGVPVALAGLVTTGVLLFDMISDPLIGYLSDRTRSRWGRRAPWMAAGAVVMAAGTVGLFAAPSELETGPTLLWVSAFFGLATVGFTMVAIPYGAMAGEITRDPKERSALTGWRMGFASLGILLGGGAIPALAGSLGQAGAALAVSPVMIGAVWLSLWMTRDAPRDDRPATAGLTATARLVLENRPFMVLVTLYGIMTLAIALITAGLPFAAIYLILDAGDNALSAPARGLGTLTLLFAAFVLGSILSQAVWVLLSHLIGKLLALVGGLVLYVLLLIVLFLQLPSDDVTAIAGLFVLAGMTNGAYQQIPWAIYPDLMDRTRRASGATIEGAFSAVWLFGQKAANALAPLLLGGVLAMSGWRETRLGRIPQTEAALAALQVSITLIPAAILTVAVLALVLVFRPAMRQEATAHVSRG